MKKISVKKIRSLKKRLEAKGAYAELGENLEEIDRGTYLLRFAVLDDDGGTDGTKLLVLMGDLGVTWEPARRWPTPCYCTISLSNIEIAANKLIRVSQAWKDGKLPHGMSGEGAARDL